MGEASRDIVRLHAFGAWITGIVGVVVLQSVVHLAVVLGANRVNTAFDLDRSNSLPDLVSTAVLLAAAAGAMVLASREPGSRSLVPCATGTLLLVLALADLLHDGAHPHSDLGLVVIGLIAATVACLAAIGLRAGRRARVALAAASLLLAGSFLVTGLDRFDRWFERERGDPVAELQIVAKEDLELAGWAFVAVALWDQARRRSRRERASSPRTSELSRPAPAAKSPPVA